MASIAAGASVAAAWGLAVSPLPGWSAPVTARVPVASFGETGLGSSAVARRPSRPRGRRPLPGPVSACRDRRRLSGSVGSAGFAGLAAASRGSVTVPYWVVRGRTSALVAEVGTGARLGGAFGTIRTMSDESTTPGAEPPRGAQPDETGIIDLEHTRPVPRTDARGLRRPSVSRGSTRTGATTPGSTSSAPSTPSQGAGVPARADDAWGSDRADALAEEAHRAAYAPPRLDRHPEPRHRPRTAPLRRQPRRLRVAGSGRSGRVTHRRRRQATRLRPDARRRVARRCAGLIVAGVVGLCLLSGLVGGVAGQLLQDRVNLVRLDPAGARTGRDRHAPPGPSPTSRPPPCPASSRSRSTAAARALRPGRASSSTPRATSSPTTTSSRAAPPATSRWC